MRKLLLLLLLFVYAQIRAQSKYDSVQAVLEKVIISDQSVRTAADSLQKKLKPGSIQMANLWDSVRRVDSINLVKVRSSLDTYGWLSIDDIGERANLAQFLVIQHADLSTQLVYLPMLRQAVKDGKAQGKHLALLEDRVLCRQGKPQIYGSQLHTDEKGKYVFYPIDDEKNVDKRRAAVGLEPLEDYARNFGVEYKLPGVK